jgi:hypothetical protein
LPNGAVSNGAVSNGAVSNGAVSNGAASSSAPSNGSNGSAHASADNRTDRGLGGFATIPADRQRETTGPGRHRA